MFGGQKKCARGEKVLGYSHAQRNFSRGDHFRQMEAGGLGAAKTSEGGSFEKNPKESKVDFFFYNRGRRLERGFQFHEGGISTRKVVVAGTFPKVQTVIGRETGPHGM